MVLFTAVAVHIPPRLVRTLSEFSRAAIAFNDRPSHCNTSIASRRSSAARTAFW